MRIAFEKLCGAIASCLVAYGFSHVRAERCAHLIAENDLVGVSSHGLNRFPRFLEWIKRGWTDPQACAIHESSYGAIERWDGCLGPGPLNAEQCMSRAVVLSREHGVGIVALRNTSHWLRAGSYAWQAAEHGCPALCVANTEPNLPPWGSVEPKLGNNPLALSVPRRDGRHVLYDGALSQFSYGTLEKTARNHTLLPIPGGYDVNGRLTDDPAEILSSRRALPIGYWKGSGLSMLLDLLVTLLSAGRSARALGEREGEYGVSQLFIAFDSSLLDPVVAQEIEKTVDDLHSARPAGSLPVRYPGEDLYRRRQENLALGVPVDKGIWESILEASDHQTG